MQHRSVSSTFTLNERVETERVQLSNRLRLLSLEQMKGQRTIAETKRRRQRLVQIKKEKDQRLRLVSLINKHRKCKRYKPCRARLRREKDKLLGLKSKPLSLY
eukprot:TRINITY_DN10475_c0_g1_i2.p2 TRINITY_DN10475_c0_g1~~TRINITY_DN10475_c0_g1_i2.p2  ORF type:complete len:103 (+),score=11.13 TRINITY_DN10475_c0_g1_i2:105-413(+)